MSIRVNVTQAHIDAGQARHCSKCPIALAILALGYKRCEVNGNEAGVMHATGKWVDYRLPHTASMFVHDFDGGDPVSPIEFTMEEVVTCSQVGRTR